MSIKYKKVENARIVKPIGKVDGATIGQMADKIAKMAMLVHEKGAMSQQDLEDLTMDLKLESYKLDLILRGYQEDPGLTPREQLAKDNLL